jgi:hypothetical protein
MTQYLLSVIEPNGRVPAPEVLEPIIRDVVELDTQMRDAGVWVFSGGLHDPSTATLLRAQDGSVVVTDGPWIESKEHLGGFTIVDVPDLDAAMDWGARLAKATTLPIEVRPFRDGPRS